MALSAIRHCRTLRLVRAFTSSILPSHSTVALGSGSDSSAAAGRSHLYGYSQLSGFERPSPPWRHLLARCRTWTDVKDCKHWLITLDFPKNPTPTREEMIDTYVKTLAAVVGSEEEAKKRIYGLSTTVYTGFHCKIDHATSERLKSQPLVNWVLSVGYGDPDKGEFGGDRYDNGVITPDPNPPIPSNDRPRKRNIDRTRFERQRDIRSYEGRDNMQMENRDTGRGDNYNYGSTDRRDTMQGNQFDNRPRFEERNPMQGDQFDNRPRFEERNPTQGDQFDNRPRFEERPPMQGYQTEYMQQDDRRGPVPPIDRRDSYQGEQRDTFNEGPREAVRGEGEGMPYRRGFT